MFRFASGMRRFMQGKWLALVSLLLIFMLIEYGNTFAQDTPAQIEIVHVWEADALGVAHPIGLAYTTAQENFLLLNAPQGAQATTAGSTLTVYNPVAEQPKVIPLGLTLANPRNIA